MGCLGVGAYGQNRVDGEVGGAPMFFERRGRLSPCIGICTVPRGQPLAPTHYHGLHNTNHSFSLPALVRPPTWCDRRLARIPSTPRPRP